MILEILFLFKNNARREFCFEYWLSSCELTLWQIAALDSGQDTKTTTLGMWRMNKSEQTWRGAGAWKEYYGVIV